MFGQMGQMMNLLKDLPKMTAQMKEAQERLAASRFQGESGGGQVKATVDGKGDLITLEIEQALVEAGDKEMIEDLTVSAVREAIKISREAMQKEMQGVTGGLDLSSLGLGNIGDMLGGAK